MKIFLCIILLLACNAVAAAQKGHCRTRDVFFAKGKSSIMLRGQLEPCNHLIYRIRAKSGQKMRVTLRPEINDLVFLIQGTKFLPERGSFVLEGIHKNGITDWEGTLPNDDAYEIWVERPAVTNNPQKRTLPFRLLVEIN